MFAVTTATAINSRSRPGMGGKRSWRRGRIITSGGILESDYWHAGTAHLRPTFEDHMDDIRLLLRGAPRSATKRVQPTVRR